METPDKKKDKIEIGIIGAGKDNINWTSRSFTKDDLEHAFQAGIRFAKGDINFINWFSNYLKQKNNG